MRIINNKATDAEKQNNLKTRERENKNKMKSGQFINIARFKKTKTVEADGLLSASDSHNTSTHAQEN